MFREDLDKILEKLDSVYSDLIELNDRPCEDENLKEVSEIYQEELGYVLDAFNSSVEKCLK